MIRVLTGVVRPGAVTTPSPQTPSRANISRTASPAQSSPTTPSGTTRAPRVWRLWQALAAPPSRTSRDRNRRIRTGASRGTRPGLPWTDSSATRAPRARTVWPWNASPGRSSRAASAFARPGPAPRTDVAIWAIIRIAVRVKSAFSSRGRRAAGGGLPLPGRGSRRAVGGTDQLADLVSQLLVLDRLAEPGLDVEVEGDDVPQGGDDDDGQPDEARPLRIAPEDLHEAGAPQLRHVDVEEQEVHRVGPEPIERRPPVVGHGDRVAVALEELREHLADRHVVVHDHHPLHGLPHVVGRGEGDGQEQQHPERDEPQPLVDLAPAREP